MATSDTAMGLGIIGVGVVILLGYLAYLSVDVETYPDVEISAGAGLDAPSGMNSNEFVSSSNSLVSVVNLPHRYPTVTGGNITSLIHHGLEPLRKRAPRDSRWIECPPAEVMY